MGSEGLTIIRPEKESKVPPQIDIVAIHGLRGHPFKTWTDSTSGKFWLKDFLPEKVQDARIMTFGYDSGHFNGSQSDISDYSNALLSSLIDVRDDDPKRPLIFIVHSLGGIVVKNALVEANRNDDYESIEKATIGIQFFGTPHRGSHAADFADIIGNLAKAVAAPAPKALRTLKENSSELFKLTSEFRHQEDRYVIVSFYERRGIKGTKFLIVSKDSAVLNIRKEKQIPIEADHMGMCRFATADADPFKKVCARIKFMRDQAAAAAAAQTTPRNKHFDVPYTKSSKFTGRRETLAKLELAFSGPNDENQRRFVLYGMGGSGKTETCLKYADKHREAYWGIFWVDASTKTTLETQLQGLGGSLKVEKDVEAVRKALANETQPWLLIFDNADNSGLHLDRYFPAGNRGNVIITSRDPQFRWRYETVGAEELDRMLPDDAADLLLKFGPRDLEPRSKEDALHIVEDLGHLALAVIQAGAFIQTTRCSLQTYLEVYRPRKKMVLAKSSTLSETSYPHTVDAALQISFDKMMSAGTEDSKRAFKILKIATFYHFDRIPLDIFQRAWVNSTKLKQEAEEKEKERWESKSILRLKLQDVSNRALTALKIFAFYLLALIPLAMFQKPWQNARKEEEERNRKRQDTDISLHLWDMSTVELFRESLEDALNLLESYAFVSRDTKGCFSLHPLVHEWCQDLEPDQKTAWEVAMALLSLSTPPSSKTRDYEFRRTMCAHARACLRHYDWSEANFDQSRCLQLESIFMILEGNGFREEAGELSEKLFETARARLGESHPRTIFLTYRCAKYYSSLGRHTEAVELAHQAVQLDENRYSRNNVEVIYSQGTLASIYLDVGQSEKAFGIANKVYEFANEQFGEDSNESFSVFDILARCYKALGQLNEALCFSEKAYERRRMESGEDNPRTLEARRDLAMFNYDIGQLTKALSHAKEGYELERVTLGEDHPDTLRSMNHLVHIHYKLGDSDEELTLLKETYDLEKKKFGASHIRTLTTLLRLAYFYYRDRKFDQALLHAKELHELEKKNHSADRSLMIVTLLQLGAICREVGRFAEACDYYETVYELRRVLHGENHPDTMDTLRSLIPCQLSVGQPKKALEMAEKAYEHRRENLGEADPETLVLLNALRFCHAELGHLSEALMLAIRLSEFQRNRYGEDHPTTMKGVEALSDSYAACGKRNRATVLNQQIWRHQSILEGEMDKKDPLIREQAKLMVLVQSLPPETDDNDPRVRQVAELMKGNGPPFGLHENDPQIKEMTKLVTLIESLPPGLDEDDPRVREVKRIRENLSPPFEKDPKWRANSQMLALLFQIPDELDENLDESDPRVKQIDKEIKKINKLIEDLPNGTEENNPQVRKVMRRIKDFESLLFRAHNTISATAVKGGASSNYNAPRQWWERVEALLGRS